MKAVDVVTEFAESGSKGAEVQLKRNSLKRAVEKLNLPHIQVIERDKRTFLINQNIQES